MRSVVFSKKSGGVEGGAAPPCRGGWRGDGAPISFQMIRKKKKKFP